MSTFDGVVPEFVDIRIDRFLKSQSARPPLATFLSHVHTDHLVGLDAYRSPFIYCSAATKEILLKLEKYPDRMNFANGILEKRIRRFEHLKTVLRAIPLETPTTIDLALGQSIRVTLFDANHCVGAVMFLIEGDGKAILYTGDIRSEAWWVNNLIRNPVLLPYVTSTDQPPLKRLDKIYLDTTFASKVSRYHQFPSKASGTMELLRKVSQYPKDTVFYLHAWTFGYEEVMHSLAAFLGSRIHVDRYKYGVYKSLRQSDESKATEAFSLIGTQVGNVYHRGCLTTEQNDQCRIHSCEKGTACDIWQKPFVRITPIVSRLPNGQEMGEVGAGGGQNDLTRQVSLDVSNGAVYGFLMKLCFSELKQQPQLRDKVLQMLNDTTEGSEDAAIITIDLADVIGQRSDHEGSSSPESGNSSGQVPLRSIVLALAKRAASIAAPATGMEPTVTEQGLPKQITFPFSRHSSYSELCLLIGAFRPKDIHPCTVDEQNWHSTHSMSHLFGHLYDTVATFGHDQLMLQRQAAAEDKDRADARSPSQTPPRDTQEFEERLNAGHGISNAPSSSARRPRRRSLLSDPQEDSETARKRRRLGQDYQLQGDFYPSLKVDHYSPPSRRTHSNERDRPFPAVRQTRSSRPSTEAPHRDVFECQDTSQKVWSQPSMVESTPQSPSRRINRCQKRIAESRRPSAVLKDGERSKKDRRQPENYGRLSPPPLFPIGRKSVQPPVRKDGRKSEDYGRLSPPPPSLSPMRRSVQGDSDQRNGDRRQSEDYGRLTPPPLIKTRPDVEYDEMAIKRELQQEAYYAALDGNWSSIELISVHGHQIKEDEL
ncbi:Hypothetical predicted protein [Lecanosticta acicola]|uniref:Metallo-beta-lactamase domain-containing protein n=1 Tax=Lecanosticta acicola TaxID=111012 RepID=A0AAI9E9C9_9PEZI|nr:Hypothetical predicted protein [Lecanosticta acicola]